MIVANAKGWQNLWTYFTLSDFPNCEMNGFVSANDQWCLRKIDYLHNLTKDVHNTFMLNLFQRKNTLFFQNNKWRTNIHTYPCFIHTNGYHKNIRIKICKKTPEYCPCSKL